MIYINQTTNLYSVGDALPVGVGWRAVANEEWNALIAAGWTPALYEVPHRVSKDTITTRVLDAGKLPELIALVGSLPPDQQFLWNGFAWFWNTNATVRGMATQLGLDPDQVLAPDPYLT